MEKGKVKQVLYWGGNSGSWEDSKERVYEGQYGGNNIYLCMKMENETC
jgi:hypothetical protein